MKNNKGLTLLHIGQLLLLYVTIFHFLSPTQQILFIGQYIFFAVVFGLLSEKNGFILLISYNLVLALGYLFIGFRENWQSLRQLEGIVNHLIFVMNMAVLYGTLYMTKSLEEENLLLKEKVDELKQYVGSSELLTKQEYEKRSSLIKRAMERRGEVGYEIKFLLKGRTLHVHQAAFNILTNLALETFRNQYDLVGKWSEASFIVLLQNTDEAGMEVALRRYHNRINESLIIRDDELVIKVQAVGVEEKGVKTA